MFDAMYKISDSPFLVNYKYQIDVSLTINFIHVSCLSDRLVGTSNMEESRYAYVHDLLQNFVTHGEVHVGRVEFCSLPVDWMCEGFEIV